MSESEERAKVVDVARSWLGTPYFHRARIKGRGVDCGQLIAAVFNESGVVELPIPLEEYPSDWMLHRNEPRFQDAVERYAKPAARLALPGDILLFKWGRSLSHGAICIGWPLIVHSWLRRGVILSDVNMEADLLRRYAGAWSPWSH